MTHAALTNGRPPVTDDQQRRREMLRSLAAAVRPRPRVPAVEWAPKHIRFPRNLAAQGVAYSLDKFPHHREILAAADDPEVEQIVLCNATQTGKTTLCRVLLLHRADQRPAPALLVGPDKPVVSEEEDRIYQLAEQCRPLANQLPPERLRNRREMELGDLLCYLGWSGNTQTLSGRSVPLVLVFELDHCAVPSKEDSVPALVANRVKQWARSLIVYESAPTDESSQIWELYQASDQRTWHAPCPHCGRWQELRFFPHRDGPHAGRGGVVGYKEDTGALLSAETARRESYFLCLSGCEIRTAHKRAFVRAGRLVPDGCRVGVDGALEGTPLTRRIFGAQVSSLLSDQETWGTAAVAWIDATLKHSRQDFVNNYLGLVFKRSKKLPKWQELAARLAGSHQRETAPRAALFVTAGVDVQLDRLYWVLRAWGEGLASWLIDCGMIRPKYNPDTGEILPGTDLAQLGDLLRRQTRLEAVNVLGARLLEPRLMGIDSQYRTAEVQAFERRHRQTVRTVAGDSSVKGHWSMNRVDRNVRTGKPYPGGLERWAYNPDRYKEQLLTRISAPRESPAGWRLFAGIEAETEYLQQVVNEAPTETRDRRGRPKIVWQVVDESIGNHYWDAETIALVCALMVTGGATQGLAESAQQGRLTRTTEPTWDENMGPPRDYLEN